MTQLDSVRNLRISDYDYNLPDERIAKHPLADRDQCKLLVYKVGGSLEQTRFFHIPELLPAEAMLVYNNTRVINARLRFRKVTGSVIEIFCLEPAEPSDYERILQTTERCTWHCLVGNNKRWKQEPLVLTVSVGQSHVQLQAVRGERHGNAFNVTFCWDNPEVTFGQILEAVGEIPIPPYLNRNTEQSDATDYQTVYSHIDGSVAAPTAGLHFTEPVLQACDSRGIARRELTLHVGAGTFQPVKSEDIGEHEMHTEYIEVSRELIDELAHTQRPVVAVGTTSVRTLESLYYVGLMLHHNPDATAEELTVTQWMPYTATCDIDYRQAMQAIVAYLDRTGAHSYIGNTRLLIAPGFRYRVVQGMITNFHQPQSTLLLLVAAFVGNENWHMLYDYAMAHDFRFLSYGDACLLMRESKQ